MAAALVAQGEDRAGALLPALLWVGMIAESTKNVPPSPCELAVTTSAAPSLAANERRWGVETARAAVLVVWFVAALAGTAFVGPGAVPRPPRPKPARVGGPFVLVVAFVEPRPGMKFCRALALAIFSNSASVMRVPGASRSEEHTSELQSRLHLV